MHAALANEPPRVFRKTGHAVTPVARQECRYEGLSPSSGLGPCACRARIRAVRPSSRMLRPSWMGGAGRQMAARIVVTIGSMARSRICRRRTGPSSSTPREFAVEARPLSGLLGESHFVILAAPAHARRPASDRCCSADADEAGRLDGECRARLGGQRGRGGHRARPGGWAVTPPTCSRWKIVAVLQGRPPPNAFNRPALGGASLSRLFHGFARC